jgi:ABC-type microcin C transport system duplicated ATPase subunit YejF
MKNPIQLTHGLQHKYRHSFAVGKRQKESFNRAMCSWPRMRVGNNPKNLQTLGGNQFPGLPQQAVTFWPT